MSENTGHDPGLKQQFKVADSLISGGEWDKSYALLKKIKAKANPADPVLSSYYVALADHNRFGNVAVMTAYADSAMAFFTDPEKAKEYPNEYLKALLTRGDASMLAKQYKTALDYYYKGKKLLAEGSCDDGDLATKIAGIYFNQKNYRLAAQGWIENYRHLGACDIKITSQKLFSMRQAALNNAAYAYQRAGMEDSASVYYQKDVDLLNAAENDTTIGKVYVRGARLVVYDNLAGICINHQNYPKALDYLNKCIAMDIPSVDGIKIPPFIKLAGIFTQTGEYAKAETAFKQSMALIRQFQSANGEYEIIWNKLYAQYMLKLIQPEQAFIYLDKYMQMNDALERSQANVYKVDVERELNIFHQQQALTELRHQEKLSRIYILCITVAIFLLLVIVFLVYRNLKSSRKNQHHTEDHNRQLQQTLTELEAANKNYIRIMRIMAHDLRNPLSGISGLAAVLLEEDDLTADNRHVLQLIESTGNNSIDMINELLKSGLANEEDDLVMEPLDVNLLLHDSVKLLQFKANDKHQQIVFEPNPSPIIITASHEKIWRIFNNLIVNAIKFSYPGSKIEVGIALTEDDRYVQISVIDNGVGIPDKDKDAIYDVFTTAKKNGTNGEEPFGLGLSITRKIVEQHRGKLWFTSGDGETVFYVELPYVKRD
ncbi:tetratricopeptide repeat-containing sensor histidine kinase [Mucilaginibacter glaciei]|uniref:histidine kinase n=1 Tax=Mucilaginibacter glaciei TaxID=2772109 RepID=A0A926RZS1_9SPHI|nr:tetratricopeptide repeat-containing sensor histidine kinase [Mucilaginibacter glaciei]MBD1392155.1 tetratricopeptide repeat-containing sensor histidine kinase [Mucilaginibacter glaciei]